MRSLSQYGSLIYTSVLAAGIAAATPTMAGGFDWFGLKKCDGNCDAVESPCADGACELPVCNDPECVQAAPCTTGQCSTGHCGSNTCGPGYCGNGSCSSGPKWHSEEWYAMRAHLPPGERQKCKHGKIMPVEPRPDLPPQPFWHQYYSVKNWPHPYDCVDRSNVRATYATVVSRGWVDVATLHPHHFDPQTQMLNSAGIAKVNYVLTGLPPECRAVYVSDANPSMTQARVANVRASLVELAGNANAMAVLPRTADNPARPAIEVETINRNRLNGMLKPVITYDQTDTN